MEKSPTYQLIPTAIPMLTLCRLIKHGTISSTVALKQVLLSVTLQSFANEAVVFAVRSHRVFDLNRLQLELAFN